MDKSTTNLQGTCTFCTFRTKSGNSLQPKSATSKGSRKIPSQLSPKCALDHGGSVHCVHCILICLNAPLLHVESHKYPIYIYTYISSMPLQSLAHMLHSPNETPFQFSSAPVNMCFMAQMPRCRVVAASSAGNFESAAIGRSGLLKLRNIPM